MSDRRLRELERLAAVDPDARRALRRERERMGIPVRDPKRDPVPGDIVRTGNQHTSQHTRRIVPCSPFPAFPARPGAADPSRIQPEGYKGSTRAWFCSTDRTNSQDETCTYIHWERHDCAGPRGGTLMRLDSWRAWARDGTVIARGDE